jgi:hypothetical protein
MHWREQVDEEIEPRTGINFQEKSRISLNATESAKKTGKSKIATVERVCL